MTNPHTKNQSGFSMIEILVALTIVGLILTSFKFGGGSDAAHSRMEDFIKKIERAVGFSVDEAAIRNVIIRVRFDLDKDPQTMIVEYGPDDHFTLPSNIGERTRGIKDAEEKKKSQDKINKKFNSISEFQDGPTEAPLSVKIIGIGSGLTQTLQTEGSASIYIYPTGEKDDAIVIMGIDEEVAGTTINAYNMDTKAFFYPFIDKFMEEDEDSYEERANEIFEEWLKS